MLFRYYLENSSRNILVSMYFIIPLYPTCTQLFQMFIFLMYSSALPSRPLPCLPGVTPNNSTNGFPEKEIIQSFLSRCLLGKHKRFCVYILSINILLMMLIEGSNYRTRWGMYIPSLTSSPHTAGWHIFFNERPTNSRKISKTIKN